MIRTLLFPVFLFCALSPLIFADDAQVFHTKWIYEGRISAEETAEIFKNGSVGIIDCESNAHLVTDSLIARASGANLETEFIPDTEEQATLDIIENLGITEGVKPGFANGIISWKFPDVTILLNPSIYPVSLILPDDAEDAIDGKPLSPVITPLSALAIKTKASVSAKAIPNVRSYTLTDLGDASLIRSTVPLDVLALDSQLICTWKKEKLFSIRPVFTPGSDVTAELSHNIEKGAGYHTITYTWKFSDSQVFSLSIQARAEGSLVISWPATKGISGMLSLDFDLNAPRFISSSFWVPGKQFILKTLPPADGQLQPPSDKHIIINKWVRMIIDTQSRLSLEYQKTGLLSHLYLHTDIASASRGQAGTMSLAVANGF